MALNDRLTAIQNALEPLCPIGRLVANLEPTEADALATLLSIPRERLSHSRLKNELSAEGYNFSRETISRHRDKWCACQHKGKAE